MDKSESQEFRRWARLICYAVAIAAFFWFVPSVRTPERLRIFAPVAMALFLLEGLRENLRLRSLRSRIPWLTLPFYYALVAIYLYALPWLRAQPKALTYISILALAWAMHTMSRETHGLQRILMFAPFTVSLFFTMGWQSALDHSRIEFGITTSWLAFAGAGYAFFWLQHQPTLLKRRTLVLSIPLVTLLVAVVVFLVRLNFVWHSKWVSWLTWPPIAAISGMLLLGVALPLALFLFSPMHRWLDKLEYAVANGKWLRAQAILPEVRAAVGGNELFLSGLYQNEGEVYRGLGQLAAAIESWEKGLAWAARSEDNGIDLRVIGGMLAEAYEQLGHNEKLKPLILRLMTNWAQSGGNASVEIRKLSEMHERVFGPYVAEEEEADVDDQVPIARLS